MVAATHRSKVAGTTRKGRLLFLAIVVAMLAVGLVGFAVASHGSAHHAAIAPIGLALF